MTEPTSPAQPPTPSSARPRVVVAGAGTIGQALAARLGDWDVSLLDSEKCDLSSIPDTEVALAGARVVVFVARASRPWGRLVQATREDLDLLLADTLCRAAPMTSVQRVVWFACGDRDPREPLLQASGVPVATLRCGSGGPGGAEPEPAVQLAELVGAETTSDRARGPWSQAPHDRGPRPEAAARVCSVQRFRPPHGWAARDLGLGYFEWLTTHSRLVRVEERGGVFHLVAGGGTLLSLQHAAGRSRPTSCVFELVGGVLAKPRGRFEFRVLAGGEGAAAVLVGFEPSLPWPVYRVTQALVHVSTLTRFGQWLAAQPAKS